MINTTFLNSVSATSVISALGAIPWRCPLGMYMPPTGSTSANFTGCLYECAAGVYANAKLTHFSLASPLRCHEHILERAPWSSQMAGMVHQMISQACPAVGLAPRDIGVQWAPVRPYHALRAAITQHSTALWRRAVFNVGWAISALRWALSHAQRACTALEIALETLLFPSPMTQWRPIVCPTFLWSQLPTWLL